MTSETPIPTDNIQPPAAPDTKLALDDFEKAMADDGSPSTTELSSPTDLEQKDNSHLEALYDIPVNITIVLGNTKIEVNDLLALNSGDIIELDRKVGEAIDILVNNRLVARGEVVLVEDHLGVTMTEIIKSNPSG